MYLVISNLFDPGMYSIGYSNVLAEYFPFKQNTQRVFSYSIKYRKIREIFLIAIILGLFINAHI